MSKDIRSFFSRVPPGTSSSAPVTKSKSKKRAKVIDSSDEDDNQFQSKKKPQTPVKKKAKKATISSSDDSDHEAQKLNRTPKLKTPEKKQPKLTPVRPSDIFSSAPSRKKVEEVDVFDDDKDFQNTLKQLDQQISKKKTPTKRTAENEDFQKTLKQVDKEILRNKTPVKEPSKNGSDNKKTSENSTKKSKIKESPKENLDVTVDEIPATPKSSKKRKKQDDLNESSVLTDEERYERKRHSAMLYQKYLKREGPSKPGSKEVPKGKPGCFNGLSFLITGILESLERDEAASIITELGGRVIKALSGKVNYLIVGDDAGPAKIEKAKAIGTKMINEDELLDLIRIKSGQTPKSSQNNSKSNIDSQKKTPKSKEKSETNESEFLKRKKEIPVDKPKVSPFFNKSPNIKKTEEKQPEKNKDVKSPKNNINVIEKEAKQINATKIKVESDKKTIINTEVKPEISLPWVEKHKPKSVNQIVGQQSDGSNAKKLLKWLQNWYQNRDPNKKISKPSPWAKSDDGAYFKAALLSGPPGVGKTTTASLVCKELNLDAVEFNASDTRNKNLLHQEIGHLLSNKSLAGFYKDGLAPTKKHVLIMDEVDGMAGNEDRGGMQELINLIKNTSVPIICMCNDRNHPKVRSLANYCFDLRFARPRVEQIRAAMLSVCHREGIQIKPNAIDQIIIGSGNDLRQTLNHLSLWATGDQELQVDAAKQKAEAAKKDVKLGPWDVIRKVFSAEDHKKMSIHDKSDLFFHDYSIGPLFVQENYLGVIPHGNKKEEMDKVFTAADSLSMGDLVDSRIRGANAWSLLPLQAIYSSVVPGAAMSGHIAAQINFPGWLGKNSKRNKFQRLLSELHVHMRLSISGSREAVNQDYVTHIRDGVVKPLIKENISDAIDFMKNYHLLREDLDSLVELSTWPRSQNPMNLVNTKTKTAFTRTYNQEAGAVPYTINNLAIAKREATRNEEELFDEEENADDGVSDSEKDDISNDAMIKAKKSKASKPSKSESKSNKDVAGTSKKGASRKKTSKK